MNQCEGLNQEIYDLYVLDLLESPLSELVKSHLEQSCSDCQSRIRQSLVLWSGIATSAAESSDLRPPQALKRRIMKSVEPARASWMEWLLMRETWAAAGIAAVISGATVWFYVQIGGAGHATPVQTVQVRPQPAAGVVKNPPAIPPPAVSSSSNSEDQAQLAALRAKVSNLENDLSAAASSAGQSESALREERDRIQNLEAELGKQKTALDASLQQRQQLEADYRRAQAVAAERSAPARTPDAAAIQRVQALEEENGRLRRDLTLLRQRAEQGLQLASFLGSPGTRLVKLKGTEAAGTATAQVLVSGTGKILLFVNDLPALPAGREYQLWMIRSSGPAIVSAGVFRASDRNAEFQVADAALLNSLTSLSVTDEPAGGSPKPTGHKVLIGTAKS
jgi:hypothetical protein